GHGLPSLREASYRSRASTASPLPRGTPRTKKADRKCVLRPLDAPGQCLSRPTGPSGDSHRASRPRGRGGFGHAGAARAVAHISRRASRVVSFILPVALKVEELFER